MRVIYILLIGFVVFSIDSNCQIPRLISYQGLLTDQSGQPKPDGTYNLTFSIYDSPTVGLLLWSETKQLNLKSGLFHTLLGDANPFPVSLNFSKAYWLGLKLENEPELTPRVQFASAAYSQNALRADTADYVKYGSVAGRPLYPPIDSSEIKNRTVVREIRIYPIPASDSIEILKDRIYLIGGRNTNIRRNGDSIIINAAEYNTLDMAYNQGGPGNGRQIDAKSGAVEIIGSDGLKVAGTKNVIYAKSENSVPSGHFINTADGNAILAEIRDLTSSSDALLAKSSGNDTSNAVHGYVMVFGTGRAGLFESASTTSTANTLEARSIGPSVTFYSSASHEKGSAGLFENLEPLSKQPALKVFNEGSGHGILSVSDESPSVYIRTAGVAGISKYNVGVLGYSDTSDGVYGQMSKAGTFYTNGPSKIAAGVHGQTANIDDPDNFGVAGTATAYGSGVLGIGAGEGHGVIGISGTSNNETTAGIRGITREDSVGSSSWPPFFPLHEKGLSSKGKVGVLGQAFKKVGVWGESLHGYGVVGTTGDYEMNRYIGQDSAGVLARASQNAGIGLIATSEHGNAAMFSITNYMNDSTAVRINNGGLGHALHIVSSQRSGSGLIMDITNQQNRDTALYIRSMGWGDVFYAKSMGDEGRAAKFETVYSSNPSPTVWIANNGIGEAQYILNSNPANIDPAVYIKNEGRAEGLILSNTNTLNGNAAFLLSQDGSGRGMEIINRNSNNSSTVLYLSQAGTGRVVEASVINPGSTSGAMYAYQAGLGRGIEIKSENTSNNTNSLYVSHFGTGRAAEFDIFNANSNAVSLYTYTNGRGNAGIFKIENASNSNAALICETNGTGPAFQAISNRNPRLVAGSFTGNVNVSGILTKGGGSFRIDHPLDPANKYLSHSFVESPDMKNIYDGLAVLDQRGEVEISLPDWFEALNNEFRYQITSVGKPQPGLFVSEEISRNKFKISGGIPGAKVSWQVTGIRKDPFAEANRIKVEENKPEKEKGFYIHPEYYGKLEDRNIIQLYHRNESISSPSLEGDELK